MSKHSSHPYIAAEKYLRLEKKSIHKHEYFEGHVYRRVGVEPAHALIAANLIGVIGLHLQKQEESNFHIYGSDMRLEIAPSRLYTYPTVSIGDGKEQFLADLESATLCNPVLVVEVDTLTTRRFDRAAHYQMMPSLQEYAQISQEKPCVELYSRMGESNSIWHREAVSGLDTGIYLKLVRMPLALSDIYDNVTFPAD